MLDLRLVLRQSRRLFLWIIWIIYINFIKYNNILVGIAESNNFDLILNPKIWEE